MQGQLFTQDFLSRGVCDTPAWQTVADTEFRLFVENIQSIFQTIGADSNINEAQTESLVIHKTLELLGWGDDFMPQVNLDAKGRESVPDLLLFADANQKKRALSESKDDKRYQYGLAILEAKRWLRALDRGDNTNALDPDAPSSQMLRYLSRVDVVSDRKIKWGILTNGATWRLYWQDARSRSEDFFELNLLDAVQEPASNTHANEFPKEHLLKLFWLFFKRSAFLAQDWDTDGRSFHAFALNEARQYEEKVSQDLGVRVFQDIFPQLADALASGDLDAKKQKVGYGQFTRQQYTQAYLDDVREAALVLLYRLLFLFYAEDRNLLPVRDARYAAYSVRKIREEVRDKVDARAAFSNTVCTIWLNLKGVFVLVDKGDDQIGMPAYNGGLFDRARSPLLERTNVPDRVMAPIIDALSRRTEELTQGWINYRDLSVSHLGGIYERLLEYALVHEVQAKDDYKDKPEINRIVARPASFARKVSGSYYTHDDLVRLILRESVGALAREKTTGFESHISKLNKKTSLNPADWAELDAKDPASQILELKICDPAMGSGHFLVALVDDLADRVLESINAATHLVGSQNWAAHLNESGRPWLSPLVARIAAIRRGIKTTASQHGWAVTDAQLDDRHIVRRMILKKTIFGVDKNPMAVELAKTSLWLHTFTVGAPLSFLDHHLKVGDSLHGERLETVQKGIQSLGALLLQGEFDRLVLAARNIEQVADLTDVDIAEAQLSKELATEALAQTAPIHAVLDFWRALRWLIPGWPAEKISQIGKLLKASKDVENPLLTGLIRLLDPSHNLVSVLHEGGLMGQDTATKAANDLIAQCRALAKQETFFHWWTSFPTVFSPAGKNTKNGFDAIIGNPPWDRIKLQEVEWFAERDAKIASQARASDRKDLIAEQQKKNSSLWTDYCVAIERAETNARVLGNGKLGSLDYPLLGGGDINLYSLFVERSQTLVSPNGIVALLTPSGIAADKSASEFFRTISQTGRLGALYDFENKKVFFPDVHASFKFCALIFGGFNRKFDHTTCSFFVHQMADLEDANRVMRLTHKDFANVNPNTGAAPIFRTKRDAEITLKLYAKHPVLVKHGQENVSLGKQADEKVWQVKYNTMFHMTNDSHLFLKANELKKQGFELGELNHWVNKTGERAVPLYEGKMVQMFDHRAADVVINTANLKRAAQQESIAVTEKKSTDRYPVPQYWVSEKSISSDQHFVWALAFKQVTSATNIRSMIASLIPQSGVGHSMCIVLPEVNATRPEIVLGLLCANLNTSVFDYIGRQKLQGQNYSLYILEQLPVIKPADFERTLPKKFTKAMRAAKLMNGHHENPTVADFVIPQVLALSYTAHDLAPFAKDLGYVDASSNVLPPFVWNEEERHARRAALDAVFFWLYGLDESDTQYVLDSFPIVRENELQAFGEYRTQKDILAHLSLLNG